MKLSLRAPIAHAVLRALALHASTDETRVHLNSVLVRRLASGDVDMVATDGHRLAIYRFNASDVDMTVDAKGSQETLIRLSDVNAWTKLARVASKDATSQMTIDTDGDVGTFKLGALTLAFIPVQADFPPYCQVLPHAVVPLVPFMNPKYLVDACTAFRFCFEAGAATKDGAVAVTVRGSGGDMDPIIVSCPQVPAFGIVVMPMREGSDVAKVASDPLAKRFPMPAPVKSTRKAA